MPISSKYGHLLEDSDVKRWQDNLLANSAVTGEVYLRTLGLYCELEGTTPKEILSEGPSKEFRDGFLDFVREMEKKGKAGSYIERFRKVIVSWFSHNAVQASLKVNIRGKSETPTLQNERIPTAKELAKILRMGSPRARVSISLMAFSGLRPGSLGNHLGTDGIRLGDFTECKITSKELVVERVPSIVSVRSGLSKARHQYFTFVGSEAMTYIQDYIRIRLERGERLTGESPLIWFDPRGERKNGFLRSALVERDVREAILKAEFRWRPYVLRAYCDTNLIIAESKGVISHPYLQFLMGHKGDIEARYSTNKRRLPPSMIEGLRQCYKKSSKFLQTSIDETSQRELRDEFRRVVLTSVGFKKDDVEQLDPESLSDVEFQSRVKEKLLGLVANNGARQKVVPNKEVEKMILEGWEYVDALPNGKAILKLPH